MRLVLDNLQAAQAKTELTAAEDVLSRVARECFKWLLCPSQDHPTGKPRVGAPRSTPADWGLRLSAFVSRIGNYDLVAHSSASKAQGTLLEA